MKNIATLCCALMLACSAMAQDTPQARASAQYTKNQFKEAAQSYEEALKSDPNNPYLHYNMGNAYYKANNQGMAVACYWRAFRLNPRNSDIRHNLTLALKNSGVDFVPAGVPSSLYVMFEMLSRKELAGAAMLFMWAGLILAAAALFKKELWTYLRIPAIASLLAFAAFGAWWGVRGATDTDNPAVVVNGMAEVKSGPLDTSTAVATVPEGHTVEVLDRKDSWYEVGIRKEGIKGWIKASSLEVL